MSLPKWIDPKMTVGNAITLLGMMATFIYGYSTMASRVDDLSKSVVKLEASDVAFSVKLDAARDLASARQETLTGRLARMEAILERIERNGQIRP